MEMIPQQRMGTDMRQMAEEATLKAVEAVVTDFMANAATEEVHCESDHNIFLRQHVTTHTAQQALALRIASAISYRIGEQMVDLLHPEGMHDVQQLAILKVRQMIGEAAREEFFRWWDHREEFIPMDETDAARHNKKKMRRRAVRMGGMQQLTNVYDCVALQQRRLREMHFPVVGRESPELYDYVRGASYRPMRICDLDKIGASYDSVWLQQDKLQWLIDGNIKRFRDEVQKGVFFWGFDESAGGRPTLRQQMQKGLRKPSVNPLEEGTFEGRILEDSASGMMLAWLTFQRTPPNPSQA